MRYETKENFWDWAVIVFFTVAVGCFLAVVVTATIRFIFN